MEARIRTLGIALVCAGLLVLCALHVEVGPARAGGICHGDSALAAAGSFKSYPFYVTNGGHIHAAQWVGDANNGYLPGATRVSVYTSLSNLRVNLFGPAGTDTSGFTIPAGSPWVMPLGARCDSLNFLNIGGTATTVTFEMSQ